MGAYNAGVITEGQYVLDVGNKFAYEQISNNEIRIKDGHLVNQGRHACIDYNGFEDVTVENGVPGEKRSDIIVARYTKSPSTGEEACHLCVVKGVGAAEYSDPVLTAGNLLEGATESDMPLYRVNLNGLAVESITPLFKILVKYTDFMDKIPYISYEGANAFEFNESMMLAKIKAYTYTREQIDATIKAQGVDAVKSDMRKVAEDLSGEIQNLGSEINNQIIKLEEKIEVLQSYAEGLKNSIEAEKAKRESADNDLADKVAYLMQVINKTK